MEEGRERDGRMEGWKDGRMEGLNRGLRGGRGNRFLLKFAYYVKGTLNCSIALSSVFGLIVYAIETILRNGVKDECVAKRSIIKDECATAISKMNGVRSGVLSTIFSS